MEGDQKKIREALEAFVEYSELVCRMGIFNRDRLIAITTKARAALAAPARNCDIGTAEEQIKRFDRECLGIRQRNTVEPCGICPCSLHGEGHEDCQLLWAQMPCEEEEGGAK